MIVFRAARFFSTAMQRGWARLPFGATCFCGICKRRVQRFLPYRDGLNGVSDFISAADVIGSDVENFECPACFSHDRERHLALYFEASGIFQAMRGASILHMAPERHLSTLMAKAGPAIYVKGDLFPTQPDVQKIDLGHIPHPDQTFDFVIANHVMEHVANDADCLREIHRVLRAGGHAILQTPFARGLEHTLENPAIDTDEARLQNYGQEDHVRLYGRDFVSRFEQAGLVSHLKHHSELLGAVDARKLGVNVAEPFFLFQKAPS